MPTTKKRLNISLPSDMEKALSAISKRDKMPEATMALFLLTTALETEEDITLSNIASFRDKKSAKFVSHKKAWN